MCTKPKLVQFLSSPGGFGSASLGCKCLTVLWRRDAREVARGSVEAKRDNEIGNIVKHRQECFLVVSQYPAVARKLDDFQLIDQS